MKDADFYAGAICALAALALHQQESIYDEVVESVGADELIKYARRDGAMRWSGLTGYLRRKKEKGRW